ncbi:Oleosin 18.2 kDa [Hibiscus syriacus]|uniref:Oleosin n=1 Tax=Hibiscus syriacus TaxID=106335 RepID=A0A6A3BM36_HIBSY|nr:oleosin 16.4 kDa-like [Hibiscus syriacus]KAE8717127.1 Oleosin 18.2 kDa [Hibiscus syriacus]
MADRDRSLHAQVHPQHQYDHVVRGGTGKSEAGTWTGKNYQSGGPSTSQVLAVLALLPIGGSLLALAGLTLTGTVIGLTVATPLFVIFSPVLVPAAIAVTIVVVGFMSSGAFGVTGLSSLSYVFNRLRRVYSSDERDTERAKRGMHEMVGYAGQKTKEAGQKTKEAGQKMENKSHEQGQGVRT